MFPADAKLGFILAGERNVTLRAKALDLFEGARSQVVAQQMESFQGLTSPRGHALRILEAARDLVSSLAGFDCQHKLYSLDLRQSRQRRSGGFRSAFGSYPASRFIQRLR